MKTAFIFPGQGAQYPGMGKEFFESSPAARVVFEKADAVLGFKLSEICFSGPEDALNKTDVCQPALLVTSFACLEAMKEARPSLDLRSVCGACAGLSLGEYTALAFAGAVSFEDAVRLTRKRGECMQYACDLKPSGMSTALGLSREKVEQAVAESASAGVIGLANFNSPEQIAVSGDLEALRIFAEKAKALGAKRVIPLKVAGAFHSKLMLPAVERYRIELSKVEFRKPVVPVVSNVTADYADDPDKIREYLAAQLMNPVLWVDSIRRLGADGFVRFAEFGSGKVLTGLLKKILPEAQGVNVEKPSDIAVSGL